MKNGDFHSYISLPEGIQEWIDWPSCSNWQKLSVEMPCGMLRVWQEIHGTYYAPWTAIYLVSRKNHPVLGGAFHQTQCYIYIWYTYHSYTLVMYITLYNYTYMYYQWGKLIWIIVSYPHQLGSQVSLFPSHGPVQTQCSSRLVPRNSGIRSYTTTPPLQTSAFAEPSLRTCAVVVTWALTGECLESMASPRRPYIVMGIDGNRWE